MTGALRALATFLHRLPQRRPRSAVMLSLGKILLRTDNTTVMAYIRNQGGRHRALTDMAVQMWEMATNKGCLLDAVHVPGVYNQSDVLSRRFVAEWKLRRQTFLSITRSLGPCTLDLFASAQTKQLPRYVTWRFDPQAAGTDAFLIPWAKERLWAFPPVALIGRLLRRLMEEGGSMLLLTPDWPSQPWWPTLLGLTSKEPLRVSHPSLLTTPDSRSTSSPPFSEALVWDLSIPSPRAGD